MISLKRNNKTGELVEATGITSQKWRIYSPNQNKDFQLSRSRFDEFMNCPRCFYLKVNKGFMSPSTPGWTLNTLTDTLLKKEFDECRAKQEPHRIMITNNLSHLVPYASEIIKDKKGNDKLLIEEWRDSLHYGIKHRFKDTNIILQGGVDDVWFNTKTKELVIADYKSQHKKEISQETYFNDPYKEGYKRQLDYYAYILKGMGFKVSSDAYFYICNAKEIDEGFHGKMLFDEVLIHYKIRTDYLETEIQKMIDAMNSENIPSSHDSCENCAYARQRSVIDRL
jgi:CRISPR/Cas system-associated exonuclease Cas4 (RecB family)|tara:strand:- start:89 stop:934 length:846 start_codon:yes stop_codon:yes gene_type:complete